MIDTKLETAELSTLLTDEEYDDLNTAEPQVRAVAFAGQDFDVEGLVRRLRNRDILVPQFGNNDPDIESAGFQRGFVWSKPQMDRFIESLLLGFPIPGVFFVRQNDKRYLVLDGQQRLSTLRDFYGGIHDGKEFVLTNTADQFKGLKYETLPGDLRRTLDNAFIQATVVDTDGSEESLESVYQIFERLNSGGTQLTPHEIRIALYAGKFIDLMARLNDFPAWRSLYGSKSARSRDQELILRIIALYIDGDNYFRPLKSFLNTFTSVNRDGSKATVTGAIALFKQAATLISDGPGKAALRRSSYQVNVAQTEAVFVGLMRRLQHGNITSGAVGDVVLQLRKNVDFQQAVAGSTSSEESVKNRLRIATEAFRDAA